MIKPLPLGRGRRAEDLGIHAELGDDGQAALVALGAPHLARFLVADDGIVDVAQHVALHQAEGQGIAPLDVLPGEKEALGPGPARQPQGVGRRQVVRLLVDVHQVGLHAPDLLAQTRVKVEVKVAVEGHGLDDQLVALGVLSLQLEDAPLVPPVGGHDDRQFHLGQARQLFQLFLVGADHAGLGDHQNAHGSLSSACHRLGVDIQGLPGPSRSH